MNFANQTLDLVIIGRSILSSVANPGAELYRGLINELAHHGHRTTYLEPVELRGKSPRDMLRSPYCEVWTYDDVDSLLSEYLPVIASADLVLLGSGLRECDRIASWIAEEARGIKIYYDTNLCQTLRHLEAGNHIRDTSRLSADTVRSFNLYLSTTGGPALQRLADEYGVACVRPLYESIDPFSFYRMDIEESYDMGFIGNFKPERQYLLESLLLEPARITPNRQFALAGAGYPFASIWPENLTYLEHLPETNRVDFYNRQACTLILGKSDRREYGYTPPRQLLAAAACGVPVLTEKWDGLDEFFEIDREVFCVSSEQDVLDILYGTDAATRRKIGAAARERVMSSHTTAQRAQQLLGYWEEIAD
ncbi:MAG: glycosyltransferase [Lewinella sp.]